MAVAGAGAGAHKCGVDEQTPEGLGAGQTISRHRTHSHMHTGYTLGAEEPSKQQKENGQEEARATAIKITKREESGSCKEWDAVVARRRKELQMDGKPKPNEQQHVHSKKIYRNKHLLKLNSVHDNTAYELYFIKKTTLRMSNIK